MITKMDVSPLNDLGKGAGRVLSVYLDVDQSKAANLNRCFVTAFKARVQEIERTFEEEYEHRDFEGCAGEVRRRGDRYLVHSVRAVNYKRVFHVQALQRAGHEFHDIRRRHAGDLESRGGGIGQRAQDVEPS